MTGYSSKTVVTTRAPLVLIKLCNCININIISFRSFFFVKIQCKIILGVGVNCVLLRVGFLKIYTVGTNFTRPPVAQKS